MTISRDRANALLTGVADERLTLAKRAQEALYELDPGDDDGAEHVLSEVDHMLIELIGLLEGEAR